MVQNTDELDPETGELGWTEEKDEFEVVKEDGQQGEDEKVYIGKVSDSFRLGVKLIGKEGKRRELTFCFVLMMGMIDLGTNNAPITFLYPRRTRRKRRLRTK